MPMACISCARFLSFFEIHLPPYTSGKHQKENAIITRRADLFDHAMREYLKSETPLAARIK
jgi:hypothetical protein